MFLRMMDKTEDERCRLVFKLGLIGVGVRLRLLGVLVVCW